MQEDLSTMTTQLQQLPRDIEVLQAANTRLKQEKLDLINARERFSQVSDPFIFDKLVGILKVF
jgi:prefoldin subunit 5